MVGGCLGITIFVVASCSIIGVLAYRTGVEYERIVGGPDTTAAITRLLRDYASEVGEGDIADQYDDVYLSQSYKSEHPVEEFETAEANVRLVDNQGVTVDSIQLTGESATARMAVVGAAGDRFAIDFVVVREDGLWRVAEFTLVSPSP